MPGFGGADKPDRFVHTVDGYARHLAGALDELGVRRAHLVLHDFGGPWGLQWAADRPDRFASATFVGIGVLRGYRWHSLARIWRTSGLGQVFLRTSNPRCRGWYCSAAARGVWRGTPSSGCTAA